MCVCGGGFSQPLNQTKPGPRSSPVKGMKQGAEGGGAGFQLEGFHLQAFWDGMGFEFVVDVGKALA